MMKFNNKPLPSFLKITSFKYSVLPEITLKLSDVPGRAGAIDNGISFGTRSYEFDFVLLVKPGKEDVMQYVKEFKVWAKGDNWNLSKLVFDAEPGKYEMARIDSNIELSDMFLHGEGSFTMIVPTPGKIDLNESVVNATAGKAVVKYTGLEKSPALIEITVPANCSNIKVLHQEQRKESSLLGSFKTGQVILIDSNTKVVKVDNNVAMKVVDLEHDWQYLKEGTNTFEFTTIPNSVALGAKIKYRNID